MLDVLKLFAPTALTLLIGTYWLNRFFVSRANLAVLVERICNALDALKDDCAMYWVAVSDQEKPGEQKILEAKIKARLVQVRALVDLTREKCPSMPTSMTNLTVNLFEVCSGGTFESEKRTADPQRFMRIVGLVYKITVALQRLKVWDDALDQLDRGRRDEFNSPPVV